MEFAAFYSGHKNINGMVLAIEEALFARGRPAGKTARKTSEAGQNLPAAAFRP